MTLAMLADPQTWILLVTLSSIEIVLGIDNLVFISIAVSRLPAANRERARKFGIAAACVTRVALLLTLAFIVLIGAYLVVEGLEIHVPKGYIYGSMGFSAAVEALNLWAKRRARLRRSGGGA